MDVKTLKKWIQEEKLCSVIDAIEELSFSEVKEMNDYLIDLLQKTENKQLRNSIAMIMGEYSCQNIVNPIINLLKDPKTKGSRGTLLYALGNVDYTSNIEDLVPLLLDKSFEVNRQTFLLLEEHLNSIDNKLKEEMVLEIKQQIEDLNEEIDFKEYIVNLFNNED